MPMPTCRLSKGKNPKASKAYWRFAPRLGRRVAQGMLSLGHAARRRRTSGGPQVPQWQDSDSHERLPQLGIPLLYYLFNTR